MSEIQIRKASRKQARLRLGIAAPSGFGKTLGSLLLAYGIVRNEFPDIREDQVWDKIGMIDTEEGSGELYVGVHKHGINIGPYAYHRLSAPFMPVKYKDTQHAMEKAGMHVVIHDSLTHAWAGSGGLLEKHGRLTDNDPKKNSYTAWRNITPDHNALVDSLLQSPSHIIGTMRSKTEYAMETGMNGKQQVRKLGMAPVQREGMEYEFTVFLDIGDNCMAKASKDRTDLFSCINAAGYQEKREFMLTPAVGKELSDWLNLGIEGIEGIAEKFAEEIKLSMNLDETWNRNLSIIQRIEAERPTWLPHVKELFAKRHNELMNSRPA